MIVPVGTCSTFTTLPPFPCPSSASFFRSASRRSNFVVALRSSFAKVLDSVGMVPVRLVAGLSAGKSGNGAGPAFPPKGGGRFLAPAAGAFLSGAGTEDAGELGTGSGTS